jgi:hypothetical protein
MEPQADTPSLLGGTAGGARRRGGAGGEPGGMQTTTGSRIPVPSAERGGGGEGHGGGAAPRKGGTAGDAAPAAPAKGAPADSGGGGRRNRDRDAAPRRSTTGAGAIIGAGAAGSAALLALLAALAVGFLLRLARAPSPGGHMADHAVPLSWPGHAVVQAASAAARAASRRLVPAPQVVAGDAFAFGLTAMLYAACRLGLADAVGGHPGGVALPDLAVATRAHDAKLGRLVRALAQHGYFAVSPGGAVSNTHLSALLRGDHPNAMCPLVGHNVEDAWQVRARVQGGWGGPGEKGGRGPRQRCYRAHTHSHPPTHTYTHPRTPLGVGAPARRAGGREPRRLCRHARRRRRHLVVLRRAPGRAPPV